MTPELDSVDVQALRSIVGVVWNVTLEQQGSERPACVAEFITRHYF
jgi:hypothetical protein